MCEVGWGEGGGGGGGDCIPPALASGRSSLNVVLKMPAESELQTYPLDPPQ